MAELLVHSLPSEAPIVGQVSSPRFFDGLPSDDLNRLPSLRSEAGWLGSMWLQASSLAGRSHRDNRRSTSGQDVYGYTFLSDEEGKHLTVLALADGLGSKRQSHIGATLAVRVACHEVVQRGYAYWWAAEEEQVRQAVMAINARLLQGAAGRENDLGTTLAVLIFFGSPVDDICGFRIGDPQGFVLQDGPRLWPLWQEPEGSPGAINQVDSCLPTPDEADIVVDTVRYTVAAGDLAFALLSDGVSNDVAADGTISKWCAERWSNPLDGYAMADTLRYQRQGSSDDRTALVLLHRPRRSSTRGGSQSTDLPRPEPIAGTDTQEPGPVLSEQGAIDLDSDAQGISPAVELVRTPPPGGAATLVAGEGLDAEEGIHERKRPGWRLVAHSNAAASVNSPGNERASRPHAAVIVGWVGWMLVAGITLLAFLLGWLLARG